MNQTSQIAPEDVLFRGRHRPADTVQPTPSSRHRPAGTVQPAPSSRHRPAPKLWPYLSKFKQSATGPDTIEYKIGEIFGELKNRVQSGYNLREVINRVDALRFQTSAEKHELSHLYKDKIKNMGNAGEYYTPRPLIRTIVKVLAPHWVKRSMTERSVRRGSWSKPSSI